MMKERNLRVDVINVLVRVIDEIDYDICETQGETLKNVKAVETGKKAVNLLMNLISDKTGKRLLVRLKDIFKSRELLDHPEDYKNALIDIKEKLKAMKLFPNLPMDNIDVDEAVEMERRRRRVA